MKRAYYETPKASRLMRFFWKAAGGDRYLLERATYSDQIKYMCLGGIIVATGAMAGLAGGYAFYTIFSPRTSALDDTTSWSTTLISVVFGIIWGLIIFNIDRFIVTSTGKGDGTEKITWEELKNAIPRIIMGMILAITISKPVEIRMFKTEIDIKLREKQIEQQTEYQTKVDKTYAEREKTLEKDFGKIAEERNSLNARIREAEKDYLDQVNGKVPPYIPGKSSIANALFDKLTDLETQLKKFDNLNGAEISELTKRKSELRVAKDKERNNNEKIANGLDGLLERIKISHEVAGWTITIFIMLLFLAIELTPIFFKLMLTKTPYDYIAENRDDLIRAEYGIEVKYDYYKDKEGIERHLIIHHDAERLIYEKIKTTDIQKELTDYALDKYKERERKKIDDNLDGFIKNINPDDTMPNA